MPYVPDASSVIRFRRVNATTNTDPTIKSRTFVAPTKTVLPAVTKASDVGKTISPTNTVLTTPRWVSPYFKGRIFLI
jgi:hypothetical protein